MANLINCGKIDKNILFPILTIIYIIIENITFNKTTILDNFYKHIFIICIGQSLGKTLSIIPFFILIKNNKSLLKDNEIINSKSLYKKEYYDKIKRIKIKKYSLIISFSLFNYIINLMYYIVMIKIGLDFWLFDIIFIILFSYIILNIKLYKHQYISTIIIFFAGITLNLINLINTEINYINILLSFFTEIIFCLNIVVNKYLMEYTFCSPYEICLYDGIISLILFLITLIIVTNIEIKKDEYAVEYKEKYYIDNFFDYYDKFNIKELLIFLFESFYYFIYYLFPLITIQNYTPCHYMIILIFDFEITFLIDFKIKWKLIITIIMFVIIFFMLLVFNEIIELNFFGFENNTKKNISQRAIFERMNSNDTCEDNNYIDVLNDNNYCIQFNDEHKVEN